MVNLADQCIQGVLPEAAALVGLLDAKAPLLPLLHEAFVVREYFWGRTVQVHVLNNAQNARCPEDCGYCSQSNVSLVPLAPYSWKSKDKLLSEARDAYQIGAYRYCIVASGRGPTQKQIERLAEAVREIKREVPVQICVSLGLLDAAKALTLKDAGVDRLNHNLNTSESRYGEICTTHTYADRIATIEAARSVGLENCCGMIVGMGENDDEIVEVALRLRELEIASIPINYLIPIEGNPIQTDHSITPGRALRILAMFRLANPSAEIRIAAGREGHLGAMEPLALYPANSLFVEGYLTTRGRPASDTYRMIRDAGFTVSRADGSQISWEELDVDRAFRVGSSDDILKPEVVRPSPS